MVYCRDYTPANAVEIPAMEELLLSEVDTESVLEALGDAGACTAAKEEFN